MEEFSGRRTTGIFGVACLVLAMSASGPPAFGKHKLDSAWRDRAIVIDGASAEWEGATTSLEGSNVAIGLLNDERFLYVCMQSRDPAVARLAMTRGLTLRLDPQDGPPVTIQFPLGMRGLARPPRPEAGGRPDRQALQGRFEEVTEYFEITGSGAEVSQQIPVDNVLGIEMRISTDGGDLVYELKVPLVRSDLHPYAIGAAPGTPVAIVLETPEIDRGEMRERMASKGGGGMRGGGRGGSKGGGLSGGAMRGGPGADTPKPLKVKTKAKLATEPVEDPAP